MSVASLPRSAPPVAPALAVGAKGAVWLDVDGTVQRLSKPAAAALAKATPPLVCHGPATWRRLGSERLPAYDLLELFAFVRPARFASPTPRGLAAALGLASPKGLEDEALVLIDAAARLLGALADPSRRPDPDIARIALGLARAGWPWGPLVLTALGREPAEMRIDAPGAGFEAWRRLGEWSEHAPEPAPGHIPVEPQEARTRLARLVGDKAEPRPQQADYASAVALAFQPREREREPHMVLAEAGTGVGKTLGYVAPASLWAEKNRGAVWISTFTRNLQHQIDQELSRLYPSPAVKALKAVVRKGRENYLCLLNFEEAVRQMPTRPQDAPALGLIARWTAATRDGDMAGGDLPGWLPDLVGRGRTFSLVDRRGECVYSACPHYRKCFIEKSQRRARRAEIVVANHALVLIQAAYADEGQLPTRLVFDEGHHLFGAADSAFSGHLSGQEMQELRRWLLGAETAAPGTRRRGLERRLEDLVSGDDQAVEALAEAMRAARALASEGWGARLAEGRAQGPAETFLALVRQQVYARVSEPDNPYSLETEITPPVAGLLDAGARLNEALARLARPLASLAARLAHRLDAEAAELDTPTRLRIEAMIRGLRRRVETEIAGWRSMLEALNHGTPPEFVDWFSVDRVGGRDADVGMHRHWVDPTLPFARHVLEPAHGVVVTSATLTDASGDPEADWARAERATGARHLSRPALRAAIASPFDYPAQTRAFVVTDLLKDDAARLASAYRELILAAGGGALGLFTAIRRLRAVHALIAEPLEQVGLPLYAQHVDGLDAATLIDIFRDEEDSSLLGTDAVRDGIDVPGRSLRLIVFDRVPWPRPDILHKARRQAHVERGGTARDYDDAVARLRLKQAFGRLVRRADDRGVFVLLDRNMPSRLAGAFPEGVEIARVGLAEAVAATRTFLATQSAKSDPL